MPAPSVVFVRLMNVAPNPASCNVGSVRADVMIMRVAAGGVTARQGRVCCDTRQMRAARLWPVRRVQSRRLTRADQPVVTARALAMKRRDRATSGCTQALCGCGRGREFPRAQRAAGREMGAFAAEDGRMTCTGTVWVCSAQLPVL